MEKLTENAGNRSAMVVELKYNQSADSAINQIKERRYQGALSGYSDRILLVGVKIRWNQGRSNSYGNIGCGGSKF